MKDPQSRQISRERQEIQKGLVVHLEIPLSFFISQNLTDIEAVTECTFACICHTVFRMFSYLQIYWQSFYLRKLLKFHPSDWLIEIYLQTEGQGTHHKMVSLQPMPGFSPLILNKISSWLNDVS